MVAGLKVVVTGGAGFIGSNLVTNLIRNNLVGKTIVVDDCSTGNPSLLGADLAEVDFRKGSILDSEFLDRAFSGADAVVHLAAQASVPVSVLSPVQSHQINVSGTLSVLESVRRNGSPLVIGASSAAVYGAQPKLPESEGGLPIPASPYAATKVATEAYLSAYSASYDVPVLPLRFFNVYGPRQLANHQYAAAVPKFINAALSRKPVIIYGNGSQTRDLVFVDTVSQIITSAIIDKTISQEPVNLALGTQTSIMQLVDIISELMGTRLEVTYSPARPGDIPHSQADTSRLHALFPSIRSISLRDGLAKTIPWYAEQFDASNSCRTRTRDKNMPNFAYTK